MPTDLDILKKAFQNVASTSLATKAWDEPLTRRESTHAEQVFPAPALPSDVGGWMASSGTPYATVDNTASTVLPIQQGSAAPSRTYFETRPGRSGFNDVDFVPYNWGTNRFGNKGGSLLGHPISWEVVGPTGKSPYTHWQWAVDTGTNTLTLEEGVLSQLFTTVAPHVAPATIPTVDQAYGLSAMPNGGLYVLVEIIGNETGGLLKTPANALTPIDSRTARFELFRVDSFSGQDIVLEASKPLTDYFTAVGANDKIKSVTLIQPKVTRLVSIPLSIDGTTQQNQVFVVVPPVRAANSEYMPPYNGSGLCPDWTVNGGFDIAGTIPTGKLASYGTPNQLPVPQPLATNLLGTLSVSPSFANQWELVVTYSGTFSVGHVVRVHTVIKDAITDSEVEQCLGWFEVQNIGGGGPYTLTLGRVPEVNSLTGEVFYGHGPVGAATDVVLVDLHDNVASIFTDPVLNISKVVAARLDHIIDPKVVDTSFRSGLSSNPPGPAVFNTITGSNPGNLTDLGFRMVLFPAKDLGGSVIGPDFDNPITSNRVVLDPTLSPWTQFIEMDYSAGVVYLSHPPVPGVGCAVAPNGIITDPAANVRNEVVLYAACVPYSREDSQRGTGIQVKTTRVGGEFGSNDAVDVYGQRLVCTPDSSMYGALGTLMLLDAPAVRPPPSGWFQLGELAPGTNTSFESMGDPNYYGWIDPATNILYGIGRATAYTITAQTRVLFLKGPAFPKAIYDSDGVRGASKRTPFLNFRGTRTTVAPDGSVVISPVATLDDAYRANDPTALGMGRVITVDGGAVEARPDATAGGDIFNASFRVNTSTSTPGNQVGYDFLGADPVGGNDPYAGFIDRRAFTPTTTATTLASNFSCDVAAGVVSVDPAGLDWFWEPTGYNKTLLLFYQDLIQVAGVTYLVAGYSGATGHDISIVNLDGTVPTIAYGSGLYTGTTATVYRAKFFTGRGDTGNPALNLNTWISGQAQSESLLQQPLGALNLYAGSATAISPGDGGGSTASLAFWSRFNILGSDEVLSTAYLDTFGRLVSSLNPFYMTGGALPDYLYRGDFVSRGIKDTLAPLIPTIGHIVEDYTYNSYRYDFLSLMALAPASPAYAGTATANIATQGEVTVVLAYSLIPYGATIAEVVSVNGDTTQRGLHLVYSTDGATHIYIRGLDDTLPTAYAPGDILSIRLHVFDVPGRHSLGKYLTQGSSPATHTSTHTLGVGLDVDSVGLVIAAPDRVLGGADRHAYRVTQATGSGGAVTPSNQETASLDVGGYHKSKDYLYGLPLPVITKQLNMATFTGLDAFGSAQWAFDTSSASTWFALTHATILRIPLELPRSSGRLDSGGSRTHRTALQYITIMGRFFAGVSLANVSVHKVRCTPGSPPTRSDTLLFVEQPPLVFPCTTSTSLAASGVGGATYYVSVYADNMGTQPVYIDDTEDYFYYLVIQSNNGGASLDEVYGVQVTYTDPGPRNY